MSTVVRCRFSVRYPGEAEGKWRFVLASNGDPSGALATEHPPLRGDMIVLQDESLEGGPVFRVIGRMWMHPEYGSISQRSGEGPSLDVIVEPARGLYADEEDGED